MAEWSQGLFGCCDDFGLCLLTFILPCVTFGKTTEAMGKYSCLIGAILYMIPFVNIFCAILLRGEIREKHGIEGSLFGDIFASCCCFPCALVQENAQASKGSGGDMPRS